MMREEKTIVTFNNQNVIETYLGRKEDLSCKLMHYRVEI